MAPANLRSNSGQATVEYLVVIVAVLIALGIITFVLQPTAASGVGSAIFASLGATAEEVTFLINLPF